MNPIQTEIRISDLLALVKTEQVKFYICHNVAFMLKDELAKNEDFAAKFAAMEADNVRCGLQELINSGCYYYIFETMGDEEDGSELTLCSQVVAQLNYFIEKIFPGGNVHTYGLSDLVLEKCVDNPHDMKYAEFQFKSRIGLLEKILKLDPEAVISVNL